MQLKQLLLALLMTLCLAPFALAQEDEDEHGHAGDLELGQFNGQIMVGFEPDGAFSLGETTGLLTGWTGDEPGFVTVEEDEPDENLFVLAPGAALALEVISMDPAFKAHTPGFADVLTSPGDLWNMPAIPFDDHPIWHIDSTDAGFDPMQTEWTAVFRIIDTGTTNYAPSEPFTMVFTNLLPAEPFIRGDANADGARDLPDVLVLLEALFLGGPLGECEDAMDANDDGELTLEDPLAQLTSIFGSVTVPLPAPGPACGIDPTEDELSCAEHDACLATK